MKKLRHVLAASTALCAVGALAACGPVAATGSDADAAAANDESLTVFISGDVNVQDLWEDGLIPAYEEANPGVTVRTTIDLHGEHDQQTVAKLTTSTQAGDDPGYDLVDAGFVTSSASEAGALLEVGTDTISGLENVPETTIEAGGGFGIPYRASSVLLAYDTTKVDAPPETLDDLLAWIDENPGEFAYNPPSTGGSGGAFVTTVLDSFLTPEEQESLRTAADADAMAGWDAGFDRLAELGASVYQGGVYPNGNTQVLELLGSGQIAMAPVWSDQFITSQESGLIGDDVAYTQIHDPSFTGNASYLGIPRTSDSADTAIDLVDFVLSSEGQHIIAEQISGYPVVDLSTLPESVAEAFADADPTALRPGYYSEVGSEMANAWDQRVP